MQKNIIILGDSNTGKSVLVELTSQSFKHKAGLVTRRIRDSNLTCVGFKMQTMPFKNKEESIHTIAHMELESNFLITDNGIMYGVDIEKIQTVCLDVLQQTIGPYDVLFLDEIGEMQLHSSNFIELAYKFINSPNICISTLEDSVEDDFVHHIKERSDVIFITLTQRNRDTLKKFIKLLVKEIHKANKLNSQREIFRRKNETVMIGPDVVVNLIDATCTCNFYKIYNEQRICSHLIACKSIV